MSGVPFTFQRHSFPILVLALLVLLVSGCVNPIPGPGPGPGPIPGDGSNTISVSYTSVAKESKGGPLQAGYYFFDSAPQLKSFLLANPLYGSPAGWDSKVDFSKQRVILAATGRLGNPVEIQKVEFSDQGGWRVDTLTIFVKTISPSPGQAVEQDIKTPFALGVIPFGLKGAPQDSLAGALVVFVVDGVQIPPTVFSGGSQDSLPYTTLISETSGGIAGIVKTNRFDFKDGVWSAEIGQTTFSHSYVVELSPSQASVLESALKKLDPRDLASVSGPPCCDIETTKLSLIKDGKTIELVINSAGDIPAGLQSLFSVMSDIRGEIIDGSSRAFSSIIYQSSDNIVLNQQGQSKSFNLSFQNGKWVAIAYLDSYPVAMPSFPPVFGTNERKKMELSPVDTASLEGILASLMDTDLVDVGPISSCYDCPVAKLILIKEKENVPLSFKVNQNGNVSSGIQKLLQFLDAVQAETWQTGIEIPQ